VPFFLERHREGQQTVRSRKGKKKGKNGVSSSPEEKEKMKDVRDDRGWEKKKKMPWRCALIQAK